MPRLGQNGEKRRNGVETRESKRKANNTRKKKLLSQEAQSYGGESRALKVS